MLPLTDTINDYSIMTMDIESSQQEKIIPAGQFKAKCLGLLDEVSLTGERLIITKHGKPVAQLIPMVEPPSLLGSVTFKGDIVSPIDVEWNACS